MAFGEGGLYRYDVVMKTRAAGLFPIAMLLTELEVIVVIAPVMSNRRSTINRRSDVTNITDPAVYPPPLRRHGNRAAGKSAAERRSRCGRGGIGRGLGSGAITLR